MNVDDAAQLIRVKNLRGAGEIADALADAGLLVTDADRAVLDAARIVVQSRDACEHPVEPLLSLAIAKLGNKLDARREAK